MILYVCEVNRMSTNESDPDIEYESIDRIMPDDIRELSTISDDRIKTVFKDLEGNLKATEHGKHYLKFVKKQTKRMVKHDKKRSVVRTWYKRCKSLAVLSSVFLIWIFIFELFGNHWHINDLEQLLLFLQTVLWSENWCRFWTILFATGVVGHIVFKIWLKIADMKLQRRIVCKIVSEKMTNSEIIKLRIETNHYSVTDAAVYYPLKDYIPKKKEAPKTETAEG